MWAWVWAWVWVWVDKQLLVRMCIAQALHRLYTCNVKLMRKDCLTPACSV